ncbi:response regulator [Gudongella sp. SC589]|jgi:two-component system KDP operon response regulator KdpE|uniref:response regulator n=1 Tax=Gudongella sp. SC589 TaxID=3385990 RepID=UPI0039047FDB
MKNSRILIIEDDKYISNFIEVSLKKDDYEVITANSAADGLFKFSSYKPEIIILDLGLPDRDGLEIIRDLREFSNIPIIVVSARGLERDKIEALDLGASDYVTKPFFMGELMARIRVIERFISNLGVDDPVIFQCDYLMVDFEKRKVQIHGEDIHLTPLEYKLLRLLIDNRGKVLTHNYIIRHVWGYSGENDTKSLRVIMANLRRKIEKDNTSHRFIVTEVGVGYRFTDE